MPDTNNNDILGTTADVNAGSAIESVQAEQIKRLESEKQQAQAASPTPQSIPNPPLITAEDVLSLLPPAVPLSAADMMQEAAQEAQARTSAAEARAAQFAAQSAAPVSRPSAFDATAANARAASRPMTASPTRSSGLTMSAPPDAGSAFDRETHEQARHTGYWTEPTPQPLSAAVGEASPLEGAPASDPRVAPSPLYTPRETSRWDAVAPLDRGFANRVPEYQQEIEAQRARAASIAAAVSPTEDAPGSFRERFASYTADWAEVGAAYRQSASEPFAEKFDSFADTAARFGVDTGVLGERVRGVGQAALANIQHELKSPYASMQAGFALEAVGKSAGAYYEQTNSGRYLTPEQQGEAQAGMLPSILGAVGTVVGAATPLGAWGGSLIGSGVGALAQGVITAGNERQEASRQIGDEFVAALGEATSKLKDFSAEAQATGAPLKELQQVLGTAASVAPLGANAIAGAGAMTNALGEYAPENYASVARQLKDPLVFSLASEMGQNGKLTQAGYQALGYKAAIEGDAEGLQQDDLAAQRATLADNPQYQAAQQQLRNAENPLGIGLDALSLLQGNTAPLAARLGVGVRAYNDSKNLEENNPGDPTAKARAAVFQQFGQIREDEGVNRALGGEAEAARAGIGLRGGSAADIAAGSAGVRASYAAQEGDINQAITALKAQLADPTVDHKALDPLLKAQIAGQQTDLLDVQNKDAQLVRSDYLAPVAERGAAFSLSVAQSVYSGQSVSARAGIVRSQEDFLSGIADSPGPLSPGERDQIRAGVLKQQYDFQEEGFGENAASYGLTEAGNRDRLSRGLYGGQSFGQMQGEEDQSLAADRARAAQLRTEADSAGVPYAERLQKLAEATGIDTQARQDQHNFLLSGYSQNLAGADLQGAQAGLAVTTAQITGGPQDVYAARGQELDAYKAKIAELSHELAQGGLTVDERIGKERELTDTRRQAAQAAFSRDQSALNDQYQLTGTGQQTLEVGEERRLRRGGNAAFDPALLDAGRARTTEAQSHLDFDLAHYGGNKQLIADDRLRVAQAGEDYQGLLDTKNDYRPTGAFTRQMANDRTAFEVALQAPYIRGGAESDPLTRGNAVIKDIRQDMAQNEANRARGQRDGSWTDDNETAYSQHRNEDALQLASMEREKRFALFNAIPNTIIGGGAMGNSVQSFSFDALTAAYAPNELVGSRGRPNVPRGGELPGSLPGNRVEAFQQHAAAGASGGSSGKLCHRHGDPRTLAHRS